MSFFPPRLDDRAFDDLVAEMLARIPAHTPEWTDARVGDPGRTMLELFAWLADTILYRANLVPERQRLKFLELLGIPVRPARFATGVVSLAFEDKAQTAPITILPGATVGGPPEFETQREVTIFPVETKAFIKRRLTRTERSSLGNLVGDLKQLYDLDDEVDATPYATSPIFTEGTAQHPGFDVVKGTVDQSLWLALLCPEPTDESRNAVRQALVDGRDGRPFIVSVGVAIHQEGPSTLSETPERRPLSFVWELSQTPSDPRRPEYRTLERLRDGTQGLRDNGTMDLVFAPGAALGAPSNDVRDTLIAGVGDLPPRLDDPNDARRLVAWMRLRPTEKLESLRISWVGLNAIEIDHGRTYSNLVVGQSNGAPDQRIALPTTSIDATSIAVEVEETGIDDGRAYVPWFQRPDLGGAEPDGRVYALDARNGIVTFGDGMRGKLPEAGSRVRVRRMRAGGGPEGNLPQDTLTALTNARRPDGSPLLLAVNVTQPLPTRGGLAAESLEDAERRIPAELRHRNRAVTESDYRDLAGSTPGLAVGRVEVLPRFKPQQERSDVPGVVSVMVLPSGFGPPEPPNPRPDRAFLESVHGWLDERRPIGTELYVIGTEYVPIATSVAVRLRDGANREQTLNAVTLAIRAFLWPLPPGGPTGAGWGLGAKVVNRELEVAVARVPGVAAASDVRLFRRVPGAWRSVRGVVQTISLRPWQLPELADVLVVVGDTAPNDPTRFANPYGDSDPGIAVPVVPEVC